MIERINAYKSSDGKCVGSIEDVQKYELELILAENGIAPSDTSKGITTVLIAHRDRVADVLTTGPKSRPAARAANGATRKRKPKSTPVVAAVGENGQVER